MGKIKNPDEKRKGGRPRLSAEEKHSYHYHVGYNEIDHNTLVYQAQQANQTVQHYLHDAPLVKVVQAHMREDQIDMVGDLAKMGGNVNQIDTRQMPQEFSAWSKWQKTCFYQSRKL